MGARGPNPGTGGRPRKPLADKIADGNTGKRKISVMEFADTAEFEGVDIPKPSKLLSEEQRDGSTLCASEIYETTWKWLNERGCSKYISPQLLERYSMSAARWVQCEEIISRTGFLAKHPTTGAAIASPYVSMSQNFMSQTNRLWAEIFAVIRSNCSTDFSGATPQDDVMERLLTARKGKKI